MNNYLVVIQDNTNPKDPLIRNQVYKTDKTMHELVFWLMGQEPEQNPKPQCKDFIILNIIKLDD